ncbi:hypothetical protein [Arthrobacter pityocampae]|uniref:hypothetical protein n=1 Tax=Arthrobacter pityocampae TaxID=547334 RepID=UPI0011B00FCC|nr:hypothetical protein [Arthrobacter pityocampae]
MSAGRRPRASWREALVTGLAGIGFAVFAVLSFLKADAWYLVLGSVMMAGGACAFISLAIQALRTDEHGGPGK